MNMLIQPKGILTLVALLLLNSVMVFEPTVFGQKRSKARSTRTTTVVRSAYEQGYRSGYSDGFNSGKTDYNLRRERDFERSSLYQEASRGYERSYGTLEEFQEGYRLGFELGHTDGYYGRAFNATLPSNAIAMAGIRSTPMDNDRARNDTPRPVASTRDTRNRTMNGRPVPAGIDMKLRLTSPIHTKTNRPGDTFTATVVDPSTYEGATIEGHIATLKRSGRLKGRTEMVLAFDTITYENGQTAPFAGEVTRIYATESVKSVDEEGHIETSCRSGDTQVRSIGGATVGAIIGGIAGGGKGAALGAIIGAGVGAGSVYIEGNKDLILDPGTELLIRTNSTARSNTRR